MTLLKFPLQTMGHIFLLLRYADHKRKIYNSSHLQCIILFLSIRCFEILSEVYYGQGERVTQGGDLEQLGA